MPREKRECWHCGEKVHDLRQHKYINHAEKTAALECPVCGWATLVDDERYLLKHFDKSHPDGFVRRDHASERYYVEVPTFVTLQNWGASTTVRVQR